MKKLIYIVPVLLLISGVADAGVSINGFLQGNYSFSTDSSNPDRGDMKWAEERFQIKLDAYQDQFRFFFKTDFYYDHIDEEADPDFREVYLDYTSTFFDVRLGRQIITWGLGDLVFINDIFPKDYEAFFSGRPLEYLKKGIDGVKIGLYPDFASFEIVVIPFFEPNNYPSPHRLWMYDPMPVITERSEEEPAITAKNTEIALRAYRDIAGFDASLYIYRGFFRQPWMMPDNLEMPARLTLFYPKLTVYGASLQGRTLDGILSLEAGYYDSRGDRDGDNPMIPNSQTRFLIGYQRQVMEDFTVGLQYYREYMQGYSEYRESLPDGFTAEKRLHDFVTLRLTRLLIHQTLRLSLLSFYSISDGDYMINPEVRYSFTDHLWAAAGANIFGGGEDWSQFGQLDRNDNVYIQIRYEF